MPMFWQKKSTPEGGEQIEVPEEFQKKIENAASKADLTELKTLLEQQQESLRLISSNAAAEAEERKRAAARKASEDSTQRQAATDEEIEELAAVNPIAAMKRIAEQTAKGQNAALLTINASNLRREVFEDSEKYPFYTGAIKEEIDKLLSQQELPNQNNRSVVEHAYFSTVGRHHQELAEGKLKSRFASSESSSRGTGGEGGGAGKKTPRTLNEEELRASKMLGFSQEDYSKMLDEEGIGAV